MGAPWWTTLALGLAVELPTTSVVAWLSQRSEMSLAAASIAIRASSATPALLYTLLLGQTLRVSSTLEKAAHFSLT
jgi:hypothetical protein